VVVVVGVVVLMGVCRRNVISESFSCGCAGVVWCVALRGVTHDPFRKTAPARPGTPARPGVARRVLGPVPGQGPVAVSPRPQCLPPCPKRRAFPGQNRMAGGPVRQECRRCMLYVLPFPSPSPPCVPGGGRARWILQAAHAGVLLLPLFLSGTPVLGCSDRRGFWGAVLWSRAGALRLGSGDWPADAVALWRQCGFDGWGALAWFRRGAGIGPVLVVVPSIRSNDLKW
jgi:hypothetical protein